MENVLVVGVNTRAVACSLKKMGYDVYSADYYGVVDLQPCVDNFNSFLSQEPHQSCGRFCETFRPEYIEELALEFVDQSDFIILLAGISPEYFPRKKLMGNYQVKSIDDKYQLYQNLKNKYHLPETFRVSDIGEAEEIAHSHPDRKFILKPRSGSGGYGIRELGKFNEDIELSNFILQEVINGINISASVLSTGKEAKTILTSRQIIGDSGLGQKEPYGYCGNIAPLTSDIKVPEISGVSEGIINHFGLLGSNGVDYLLKDGELYIIEVNPRIQGTMECAEAVLNRNMMEAHINACQGTLIDIPLPDGFAVKMIVHARERSHVGNLNIPGVYDLPKRNVIIEEGEPVVTVITSNAKLNNTTKSAKKSVESIYKNLTPY